MRKFLSFLSIVFLVNAAVLERSQPPKTFDVFWNSTNPLFEPFSNAIDTPGYWEISASPHDVIKFLCPKKQGGNKELLYVYKVSQSDFERCSLSETARKVVECTSIHTQITVRHTLRREYGLDDAYYITTSTGSQSGLDNKRFGLCLDSNMRLAVHFGTKATYIDSTETFDDMPTEVEMGRIFDRSDRGELFLTEENGIMSWKKNVFPNGPKDDFKPAIHIVPIAKKEKEVRDQTTTKNDVKFEREKFENSKQIDPLPLDDELINIFEKERRMELGDYDYPNDVRVLELGGTIIVQSPFTGRIEELSATGSTSAGFSVCSVIFLLCAFFAH